MKSFFQILTVVSFALCSCLNSCAQQTKEDGPAVEVLPKDAYEALSAKYVEISDFDHGRAHVLDSNDKCGLIDNRGKILIDCVYDVIIDCVYEDGVGLVKLGENWGIYGKDYKMMTKFIYDYCSVNEGLVTACLSESKKYGVLNARDGSTVIPFDYDFLGSYSEGLFAARIWSDGYAKAGFIDKNNKVKIPFIYADVDDFSEGLAAAQIYDKTVETGSGPVTTQKCGFINKKGDVVIPFKFKWQIHPIKFTEGLCAIGTENNDNMLFELYHNSFIDTKGNVVITGMFTDAQPFINGVAQIKNNGKYGFINKKGEIIIPCEYDYFYGYGNNRLSLEKDGIEYYFTFEGKLIKD